MTAENSNGGMIGKDMAGTDMGTARGAEAPSGGGGVTPKSEDGKGDVDDDLDRDDAAANLLAERISLNSKKSALRREALKLARKRYRDAMNLAKLSQKTQEEV